MRAGFLTIAFVPVTADAVFSGITTFAKLPWVQCLTKEKNVPFDIAFLGAPFVSFRHITPHTTHKPLMVSLFAGHRHVVQAGSTLRTRWYTRGIAPPDVVRWIQRAVGSESVLVRAQDRRLRRHTRDAVRQRVCHPADRGRSPGPAASHAVLRPAERFVHGRAARTDLEGWEAPPAGDHARRRPHDRVAALTLHSQRVRPDLGHPFRLAPGHVEAERVWGSAKRTRGD